MTTSFSRRNFLKTSSGLFALPVCSFAANRSATSPEMAEGIALGDISQDGLVLWSRTNQPAHLNVEWSRYEDFRYAHKCAQVTAFESNDFTTKLSIRGLPEDRDIYIRAYYRSLHTGKTSPLTKGYCRTPPLKGARSLTFAWSGDLGGQGFGINPEIGGYRIFETISKIDPDVFFNCGDVIYADAPLRLERTLSNGKKWYNLVTPEKERVAQSLSQFRGNFHLILDKHFRHFSAHCPQVYTWDDHETKNNWYPNSRLRDARYTERKTNLLSA